jgi:hypothetical protein
MLDTQFIWYQEIESSIPLKTSEQQTGHGLIHEDDNAASGNRKMRNDNDKSHDYKTFHIVACYGFRDSK